MRKVIPAVGIAAVLFQLIRLWPLNFNALLSAMVTGGVMYLACKIGWVNEKNRILQKGDQGWGEWLKRSLRGGTIFLVLSLAVIFYSFHNPICEEFSSALYGRCQQYSENMENADKTIRFNPATQAIYPLLLAIAYYAGRAAMLRQYISVKRQVDNSQ